MKRYVVINLLLFVLMAAIGFPSRMSNFFELKNHTNLEHFVSGLGISAFAVLIFYSIIVIYFKTNKESEKKPVPLFFISLVAGGFSLVKAISWEFYNNQNTSNQFMYDVAGILMYLILMAIIFKNKKTYEDVEAIPLTSSRSQ